jgi:serine/threonine protein kinase/DNA-binding winged helix-turn-helix (wHTH) protein
MAERVGTALSNIGRIRHRWHFARAVLDERTLELLVDGVEVELERKPLEVLLYLLQHAGEVCTKDELLASVWPGRVLTETVLTKCIGRLREVLCDSDQEIIKTAYGFGYRLVAPVSVENTTAPEIAVTRLDFRVGDHPPGRPLWTLVERLGAGGHGEAWRAKHDKTHEQRVFKFALDEASLSTLKREITLFRVINDTLGEGASVVRLLDWNLEQMPYSVEAEYLCGGSLIDWVRTRGGFHSIPLSERLEVVAKIAVALAAVHSVGVLHKDLKPSNILVEPKPDGSIDIVLADFGSGSVLDAHRFEQLGITRLGFTKTIAASDISAGTPMYLAPEVLAGQPFTVKADIYALAVTLYQCVVGDFHRIMSPGWERDVEDELLREDISMLAEGNPALRLADAGAVARRLRGLEERRRQLQTQREAVARTEEARRQLERARARRLGLTLAFAMLVLGLVASTALYFEARSAQQRSAIAAAQSRAVVEYLSKDVFAPVSSGTEPVRDMSVTKLLTRAGDEVDARFSDHPEIASELHFIIGRSLHALMESPFAIGHFERAMVLGEHLDGEGSVSALRSAAELINIDYVLGRLGATIGRYEEVLAAGRKRLGPGAAPVLELRLRLARGRYVLGEWRRAAQEMASLLSDLRSSPSIDVRLAGETELYSGQVLIDLAAPLEAQTHLHAAIDQLSPRLGARNVLVAEARTALGHALSESGAYSEARNELDEAQELVSSWAVAGSWTAIRPQFFTGLLLLHQDRPVQAEPFLTPILNYEDDNKATYLEAHKDSEAELDHTGAVRQALGEAYAREGRLTEAIATLKTAVAVSERADGSQHPAVTSTRLSLIECLLAAGHEGEAKSELTRVPQAVLADLPAVHPILAQWYRVEGLLALAQNALPDARKSLTVVLDIDQRLYGPNHWRTVRARHELARASG